MTIKNIQGTKYGRLTAIQEILPTPNTGRRWDCLCECGNMVNVSQINLRIGNTKSCGCLHKDHVTTHGSSKTKLYKVWTAMKQRCLQPTCDAYIDYGGRGITICSEWLNDYTIFHTWAMTNGYQQGKTIDRRNNNMGYSPNNCRWTNQMTQRRNSRKSQKRTSIYKGVCWHKQNKKWFAYITVKGKSISLGTHDSEKFAAQTRDQYIIDHNLKNFIMNFRRNV